MTYFYRTGGGSLVPTYSPPAVDRLLKHLPNARNYMKHLIDQAAKLLTHFREVSRVTQSERKNDTADSGSNVQFIISI